MNLDNDHNISSVYIVQPRIGLFAHEQMSFMFGAITENPLDWLFDDCAYYLNISSDEKLN